MGKEPGDRENGNMGGGALLIMIIRCVYRGISMPSLGCPVSNWKGSTNVSVPVSATDSSPTDEYDLEGRVVEQEKYLLSRTNVTGGIRSNSSAIA